MINEDASGSKMVVKMMTSYMAWANNVMLNSVSELPTEEITKPRKALFGSIAHTFNHILIVEEIYRAHLEGREHGYVSRNTETSPLFEEVKTRLHELDSYYVDLANTLNASELQEIIEFEFVGGGKGKMSRLEIFLHLSNHATYHRGFISSLLFQIPFSGDANDLSVFLRDAHPSTKL